MPQVLDRRDEIPLKQRDDEKEPKLNKTEGRPNTAALIKRQQPDSPFLGEPGCCCSVRRAEAPRPVWFLLVDLAHDARADGTTALTMVKR